MADAQAQIAFRIEDRATGQLSEMRVRIVAMMLAGMRWPGAGSFEGLSRKKQQAALEAARAALLILDAEPD